MTFSVLVLLLSLAVVASPSVALAKDRTAPVTKASVGSGWSKAATIKLKATDKSGIKATYYRFGAGRIYTYKKPFRAPEGLTALKFWSVDKAKNKEKQRTISLHIDRLPPTSVSSADGNRLWVTGAQTVRIGAFDSGSGVATTYYRIGNAQPAPYVAPITISREGRTVIAYWSVDRLGNVGPTHVALVKIDMIRRGAGSSESSASREVIASGASEGRAPLHPARPASFFALHVPKVDASSAKVATPLVSGQIAARTTWTADATPSRAPLLEKLAPESDVVSASPTTRNPACVECHSSSGVPVGGQVFFRVGLVDRASACAKCHVPELAGTHPYHNQTANCGAFCHSGWGASLTTAIPIESTPYGAFASASSKDATSGLLHVIHGAARWPAGVDKSDSRCASCHAAAACDSCHDSAVFPIDQTHANHGATGSQQYPAQLSVTRTVGYGVPSGDQSVLSAVTKTEQCSTPACHNTAGLRAKAPLGYDDFAHAADPANNMASNAPTMTGTWKSRTGMVYTGGFTHYSNESSATFSVTVTGIQAAWVSQLGPDSGFADVLLDGVWQATVDAYAPSVKYQQTLWTSGQLSQGPHTITIVVRGAKRSAASDSKVFVDRFLAWTAVPGLIAPLCTSCHPDRTQVHGYDPVAHAALPSDATCTGCHVGALGDIHSTATTTVAGVVRSGCTLCHYGGAIPSSQACATCHGASPHATTTAFCYTCHTPAFSTYPGKSIVQTSKHMTAVSSSVASVQYPGTSYGAGTCANCHQGHNGLRATGDALCYGCHDAAGTTKPTDYSYQGESAFSQSGHAGIGCASCHDVHGTSTLPSGQALVPRSDSTCLTCHDNPGNSNNGVDVAAAFSANGDPLSHHDIAGVTGGSSNGVKCESCHNPHASSASQPLSNPGSKGQLYDTSSEVPADSVERTEYEVDLPIIEDTTLDSTDPSLNFGGGSTILVDPERNGLLKVDDSQLPPDSYITSAELHVYAPGDQRGGVIGTHLLTDPDWDGWSEGSATWDECRPGVLWGEYWDQDSQQHTIYGGADETNWQDLKGVDGAGNYPYGPFGQTDFSSMSPDDPWASFDVTTQMQAIYRRLNAPYTGILLKSQDAGGHVEFTSINGDSGQQPYVHVTYYRTSTLIDASADTEFNALGPADNFGWNSRVSVGPNDTMLVNFDLSAVPTNATITSVRLMLYCQQGWSQWPGDGSFSVYKVNNAWDENGSPGSVDLGDRVATLHPDDYQWNRTDDHWLSFDGKEMLDALSDPNTNGLAIVSEDGNMLDVATRENDDWHAPKLEVQYSYADPLPTSQNSIAYCTQCHGDSIPAGIGPIPSANGLDNSLAFQYDFHNSHGQQLAWGTSSRPEFDWDASLKDPYFYGMGPLQCSDCHDPHGSSNLFHLKENINGSTGLTVSDQYGNDSGDVEQWCGACHNFTPHEWWGPDCLGCHYHGRNTSRRF